MWPNPQFPGELVTLTEQNLNGKLHFCVVSAGDSVPENHICWKQTKSNISEKSAKNKVLLKTKQQYQISE